MRITADTNVLVRAVILMAGQRARQSGRRGG
jgi:hypothetical protein